MIYLGFETTNDLVPWYNTKSKSKFDFTQRQIVHEESLPLYTEKVHPRGIPLASPPFLPSPSPPSPLPLPSLPLTLFLTYILLQAAFLPMRWDWGMNVFPFFVF